MKVVIIFVLFFSFQSRNYVLVLVLAEFELHAGSPQNDIAYKKKVDISKFETKINQIFKFFLKYFAVFLSSHHKIKAIFRVAREAKTNFLPQKLVRSILQAIAHNKI